MMNNYNTSSRILLHYFTEATYYICVVDYDIMYISLLFNISISFPNEWLLI